MSEQSTATTTSESLYSNELNQTIQQYRNNMLSPLNNYKFSGTIPTDIVQLLQVNKLLERNIASLKSVQLPPLSFDPKIKVVRYYETLENATEEQKQQLINNAEEQRKQRKEQHDIEVANVQKHNAGLSEPYKQKHNSLLQYKDSLKYTFERYDITPMDIQLSDNLTVEEFETLIDRSIEVCEKYVNKSENNLFDRIIKPIKGEKNLQFTLSYIAFLLIICYISLPILTVPVFAVMFKSIHNLYKDIEALRIANALMTQVDYERFVNPEDYQSVEQLDLSDIDETLNKQLEGLHDYGVEKEQAIKEVEEQRAAIAKICEETQMDIKSTYAEVLAELEKAKNKCQEAIDKFMSEYKPFPTVQSESAVMSHSYVLGRIEDTIDVREELPLMNIVFDASNRELAIKNMKLYLCNILLSVRVKQLTVEIYDPKNMCEDFTEFFTTDTKQYIKPNSMNLSELFKLYKEKSQSNIIELDNKDIDTYNRICEEQEIVPKEYQLLIILSNFEELKKGEKEQDFREYMKFSAQSGVMIWLLDSTQYANCLWVDGKTSLQPQAIQYTRELGKQAVNTYTTALASYKDRGIDYVTKFGDVQIPRDKWWTWDTIKGVALHFGLQDGDPNKRDAVYLGDANVHALLGGATGAGKSATINQTLISLITMYPPSELLLVYIDFKNVEAAKFTRGYDKDLTKWMSPDEEKTLREKGEYYSRLSRIPQLRIISGTTDGEYALSVFEFLMQEMARRQQIINKFGVTKIQEMREQILAGYNEMKNGDAKKGTWAEMRRDWEWYKPNVYDKYGDLPRLVVVFDEFQVMFNPEFVDQRIIDTINGKITAITKLARAMACHFWFTSQSMKGTMSKDTMGNFSLRGALRCTSEVSDELLGNNAAGTIKAKFGFMYTNDSAGQDKEANKFWRVPFLDEKKMPWYIDQLNNMLDEYNEKHCMAEFYDEKILVPSTELDKWYANYPETFNDPRVFIFGERAAFSTNKAPYSLNLMDDGGENIIIAAFERNDMMNLALTMIDNIRFTDATLIINCQDKDTYELMAIDTLVDESFIDISKPSQDIPELIDTLDAAVKARQEAGGPYNPMYIVCIQWERAPGISVDSNYKLQDKFKEILRNAPSVGIHFIFACREKLDMPRIIPNACNHKVGGLLPKDAFFFISSSKVEKLPSESEDKGLFAIYEYGSTNYKFRIYQHKFTRTIKSREVIIEE